MSTSPTEQELREKIVDVQLDHYVKGNRVNIDRCNAEYLCSCGDKILVMRSLVNDSDNLDLEKAEHISDAVLTFFTTELKRAEIEGRIKELESFKLPYDGDHSKCLDPTSCIGYQNAQSDFDNEQAIRLAELTAQEQALMEGNK